MTFHYTAPRLTLSCKEEAEMSPDIIFIDRKPKPSPSLTKLICCNSLRFAIIVEYPPIIMNVVLNTVLMRFSTEMLLS